MPRQAQDGVVATLGLVLSLVGCKPTDDRSDDATSPRIQPSKPRAEVTEQPRATADPRPVVHVDAAGEVRVDGNVLSDCVADPDMCVGVLEEDVSLRRGADLVAAASMPSGRVLDVARLLRRARIAPIGFCEAVGDPARCRHRVPYAIAPASALPPESAQRPSPLVSVARNGTVTVGAKVIGTCKADADPPCDSIAGSLKRALSSTGSSSAVVRGDAELAWKTLLSVVESAAGAADVGLLLEEGIPTPPLKDRKIRLR